MTFHGNHLPADDSHEISNLTVFVIFEKACRLLQIIGGAFMGSHRLRVDNDSQPQL